MTMIWIDVETTGLSVEENYLLEVGMIATDNKLVEQARISCVIKPGVTLDTVVRNGDAFVREMHGVSGLWDKVPNGMTIDLAEAHLSAWVDEHSNGRKLPMCGSSVHFDRKWVERRMPILGSYFSHRNIDVSSFMETYWIFCQGREIPKMRKGHRALSDLEDSLTAYRFYLNEAGWLPKE